MTTACNPVEQSFLAPKAAFAWYMRRDNLPWPISNHESPNVDLSIPRATAPHYLWAMLATDGEKFRDENYAVMRNHLKEAVKNFESRSVKGQAPSSETSDSRLRTWKKAFEQMGLLTVEDDRVKATRFGRAVVDGLETAQSTIDRANAHIAELGALVANRVLLASPGAPSDIPSDSDLRPLRAIWRAFRSLDNKLHWQDINRVLGHLYYEAELQEAIDRIVAFRAEYPAGYPMDDVNLSRLGNTAITDDPRHITPWFNRAGVGGLLLPAEPDSEGFRRLPSQSQALIDDLLGSPPPAIPSSARADSKIYTSYLIDPVERHEAPETPEADAPQVARVLEAVEHFGEQKFIVLSGLPGTGKSRLARLVSEKITDGDQLRLKEVQFHKGTSYDEFVEGYVPKADGSGFERRSKSLRLISERAKENPEHKYVLLIEEFTRADVISVLGELLTYIEHRNRRFTYSLSQEESVIPPNLVVLCTMNPRDRSVLNLDDALGRRMHRVEVSPSVQSLNSMLKETLAAEPLATLMDWYSKYFQTLPFGHGVFFGADSAGRLKAIWDGTIVPLISDPLGRVSERYVEAAEQFPFREFHLDSTASSGEVEG